MQNNGQSSTYQQYGGGTRGVSDAKQWTNSNYPMNANQQNRRRYGNTNPQQHNNSNHNNNNSGRRGGGGGGGNGGKGPTRDTWKSPFPAREQNIMFFMYAYKVEACQLRRNCPSKVTCPGWHHEGEKRRNPGDFPNYLYSEEPCPHVKPQGSSKWQPPSSCNNGDECGYSHTLLEQMYHPNIYKTSMCINFTNPRGNKCQWGYYCTHAHGTEDIRNPSEDSSSKDGKSLGNRSVGNTSDGGNPQKNEKRPNMSNMGNTMGGSFMPHQQRQSAPSQMMVPPQFNRNAQQQYVNQGGQCHPMSTGNNVNVNRNVHSVSPQFQRHTMNGMNTMNTNGMNAMNGAPNGGGPMMHNMVNVTNHQMQTSMQGPSGSPYQGSHGSNGNNSPNTSMTNMANHTMHALPPSIPPRHYSNSIPQGNNSPLQRPTHSTHQTQAHSQYANNPHHPAPPQSHQHHQQQQQQQQPPSVHKQYANYYHSIQRQNSRPKSISAPPLPVDNHILNQFPSQSPHQTPLPEMAENTMVPADPLMPAHQPQYNYGPNGSPVHSYHHQMQHHHPQPAPLRELRSRSYDPSSNDPYGLPKLDAMTLPPPGRTTSDGATTMSSGFVMSKGAPEPQHRPHSRSEPLKPDHFLLNDPLWSLAPSGSAENIYHRPRTQHAPLSSSIPKSMDDGKVATETRKQLSSIPDDCLLSPSTMEGIITPKQEIAASSDGKGTPSSHSSAAGGNRQDRIAKATWHAFGFSQQEVMSPTDATGKGSGTGCHTVPRTMKSKSMSYASALEEERPSLQNRGSLKIPISPTSANAEAAIAAIARRKSVDENQRLKLELKDARKEIERLQSSQSWQCNESVKSTTLKEQSECDDGKEEDVLSQSTPLEASSKKSVDLYTSKPALDLAFVADDEKGGGQEMRSPMVMERELPMVTVLQQQQLARYEHFITCPWCKVFDQNTPRNQVLVPCGHLLCTKCTAQNCEICPLCQSKVESLQQLVIG